MQVKPGNRFAGRTDLNRHFQLVNQLNNQVHTIYTPSALHPVEVSIRRRYVFDYSTIAALFKIENIHTIRFAYTENKMPVSAYNPLAGLSEEKKHLPKKTIEFDFWNLLEGSFCQLRRRNERFAALKLSLKTKPED
ncbi:MAG: hypothetical protein KI786_10845 [Mameliella sp.]|nr:hypothetical protein [Phaeodactylibacter sp.]